MVIVRGEAFHDGAAEPGQDLARTERWFAAEGVIVSLGAD